jgi:hypothetical protein
MPKTRGQSLSRTVVTLWDRTEAIENKGYFVTHGETHHLITRVMQQQFG